MDGVSLNGQTLAIAAGVFLLLCIAIGNVGNAIDTIRGWKKPRTEMDKSVEERLREHETRFANDKRALDRHDKQLSELSDGTTHLIVGVQALLEHELHNGNADEMQDASKGLSKWLAARIKES